MGNSDYLAFAQGYQRAQDRQEHIALAKSIVAHLLGWFGVPLAFWGVVAWLVF